MASTDSHGQERHLRIDLSTRHLQALVCVARYHSFAAAAIDLGLSQPTLTRTVRRAEDVLGVALFTRTTRRVSLTEAGREFIPLAQRLLGDLDLGLRNIRELATVERGHLIIATLMTVAHGALPPAVARFTQRYPSVSLDLREGVQAGVLEEVRSGSADFGLGDETDIGGPLESDRLGIYGFSVVLPKGHRLLSKETLTFEDIADERLVAMPTAAAARRTLDAASLAAGVALNSHFTVSQFTTAFELVSAGLGVAVIPSIFFARPHPANTSSRPLNAPGVVQRLGVITRSDRVLTPAASAFIKVLRECWPTEAAVH